MPIFIIMDGFKPPTGLGNKVRNFNKFYHEDSWIQENLPETKLNLITAMQTD
jgi:hypothetical protein